MLLTRAPLNQLRITTQLIPCDLHVLNTPPAFVLSQNQTLRKNDLIFQMPSPADAIQIGVADLEGRLPRTVSILKSDAQRTI
jgi:hypothetical protein